jgi:GntR family transcriptional regulator, transcriptional repressor for pyruvate dehydrogenase complex
MGTKDRGTIERAARALREVVLDTEPGELIGSEDALVARLGASRSTVRQVARILEREGFLMVRRGIRGGYFSARPDALTIEASVSSYLDAQHVDSHHVTTVASLLWVEAMRMAAQADRDEALALTERLIPTIKAVKDKTGFDRIRELELQIQAQIFELSRAIYIKLIFDINMAFSRRRFSARVDDNDSDSHVRFVRAWRDAKLLELSAIAQGDAELAGMAGQHSRRIWHKRIMTRFEQKGD